MLRDLPAALRPQIEMNLGAPIQDARRLTGGDINEVLLLDTARGQYVLKHTQRPLPYLFFAESQGLHLLGGTGNLTVPKVIAHGDAPGGFQYLLLTYLPPAPETPEAQEALGRGLAALHRHTASRFGWTASNYIGALPQQNTQADTAAAFFWQSRLEPQLTLASSKLGPQDHARFEELRARLPTVIPDEPPALVHGDLWHGNMLYTALGPALIDPAVAFSHREVDLSMMRLFGGFPQRVFDVYVEANPPAAGWQERAELWNLYPLLVHVNLFGGQYVGRLRQALDGALKLG